MALCASVDFEEVSKSSFSKRKQTGTQCAVAKCSLRHSEGVSLYSFPKNTVYRRQWINFVRTCRANFVPTSNSKICSKHFRSDCYPITYTVQASLGFAAKRKTLLPTAVPTIQKHELSGKRLKERIRIATSVALPTLPTSNAVTSVTNTVSPSSTKLKTTGCVRAPLMCVLETAKKELSVTKVRGAYAKREHVRALNEIFSSHPVSTDTAVSTDTLISSESTSKCMEANTWLTKTEGNCDINLQPSSEPTEDKHPCPVKNIGPVKRASDTDSGSPKILLKTIKMEDNPDIGNVGMTSAPRGQYLDASCLYKVVLLDDWRYTTGRRSVSSARCLGPVCLHKKNNNSSMRGRQQNWTATSYQCSADVHCDVEVEQEVSSDEEECPAQLEVCDVNEEAVTECLSPHHIPHQGIVTTKETCSHEKALLTPKCEPQRTRTLENVKSSHSRFLTTESQKEHRNLINPAFIKKEPKDFETLWNAETMTQISNHSSDSKARTEITMAGSEESSTVNKLTPFIKKEPEDFNSSWSVMQTDNEDFENKMETKVYPTGIYRNVHFAQLKRGDRQ